LATVDAFLPTSPALGSELAQYRSRDDRRQARLEQRGAVEAAPPAARILFCASEGLGTGRSPSARASAPASNQARNSDWARACDATGGPGPGLAGGYAALAIGFGGGRERPPR
jgi:hypothetical protein